ncbi:21988_t:CDS:1, partial [Gigaspora margarita]
QEHPMDLTVNINQNISISERDSSFQGSMSENLTVEKKKSNTEDLIDLCSEIPTNNTIALNEIEKSSDIMPPHSQIKSHNIHLSTKTQKMVSFYCTACGHTNQMLTEDINQILIKKE